jgi:hypothetical protein
MNPYLKSVAAAVTAGMIALTAALTDESITAGEWVTVALAVLGALGVYAVENAPAKGSDRSAE